MGIVRPKFKIIRSHLNYYNSIINVKGCASIHWIVAHLSILLVDSSGYNAINGGLSWAVRRKARAVKVRRATEMAATLEALDSMSRYRLMPATRNESEKLKNLYPFLRGIIGKNNSARAFACEGSEEIVYIDYGVVK